MQSTDPIKQLRLALLALVALMVLGTFGYHILMGWSPLDSLYMTVMTLSTVGFREMGKMDTVGKVFTMSLIVFGVTIVFWAGASLIEVVIGEQIWHAMKRKRMQKHITRLRDHYIICGFGRMGQQIVNDLRREGVAYAVIERNPEQLPKLIAQDIPFVEGNASDDKSLTEAGIERAKGLITVAPTDEDNVFITLSARALNPKLFIVARSIMVENEDKLKMAGADRVMSPYVLGGRRMALAVLRPNVLDFLELAIHSDEFQIMLEELVVTAESPMAGQTLKASNLEPDSGVTVIGMKKVSKGLIANPSQDELLEVGDVLIVLGVSQELNDAQASVCPNGNTTGD